MPAIQLKLLLAFILVGPLSAQDFAPASGPAGKIDKVLLPLLRAAPEQAPERPRLPAAMAPAEIASKPEALEAGASDGVQGFCRGENALARNHIVAFYGHPNSKFMGILGEYPLAEAAERLKLNAAEWDKANGDKGIIPAFHLIYAVAAPGGELSVMGDKRVREYVEYARKNNILVFLDHQIGKIGVKQAVEAMLPWLKFENVHLAMDPEWSTLKPNEELGSVRAEDVNLAQKMIQDYLKAEKLPGKKMFMVHQFNWKMISKRQQVKADQPDVLLIHNSDGFGTPEEKHKSYAFNKLATNMPLKGFKLFLAKDWRKGGFDVPLLTPAEVLALDPEPVLIMYQ